MAQTERVKCTREKGYRRRLRHIKFTNLQFIPTDKTVNLIEDSRIIEKSQLRFLHVFIQGHKFLAAVTVDSVLFVKVKAVGTENMHSESPKCLLADCRVIVGKAADNKVH